MMIAASTRLGRYEIRSQLGAGGMGEVYLAQDTKLDRKVALKILPAEVAAHPDRMKRFVQEAKAASALNHPNIITIHEIEQIDSVHFIATEFIDAYHLLNGGSLLKTSAATRGTPTLCAAWDSSRNFGVRPGTALNLECGGLTPLLYSLESVADFQSGDRSPHSKTGP